MKNKKMISIGMFFVVFFCSTIFSFAETRTLLTKNGGEVNLFEKTEKIEKTVKKNRWDRSTNCYKQSFT